MINSISLKNFKCHKELYLQLKSLNVVCGQNGVGKSSLIQSLLLLTSYKKGENYISINNSHINLGKFDDVLNRFADEDYITFGVCIGKEEYNFVFKGSKKQTDRLLIKERSSLSKFGALLDKLSNFQYISAERISPQNIYPVSNNRSQNMDIGARGQFVFEYLAEYGMNECKLSGINDESFIGKDEKQIKSLVTKWLGFVTKGVTFDVADMAKIDMVNAIYKFDNEMGSEYRPINVGFGVTYVLPVIVSLIKATPGSIVIIENPESHLHPSGQRKMGELIARVAASGVQVIIETHSDHVINGIRLGVKGNMINSDAVALFHFDKANENKQSRFLFEHITINNQGKLSKWPKNFFDEYENALSLLF